MRADIIYYRDKKYRRVKRYEKIKKGAIESRCGKEFLPLQNLSFVNKIAANFSRGREFYNPIPIYIKVKE